MVGVGEEIKGSAVNVILGKPLAEMLSHEIGGFRSPVPVDSSHPVWSQVALCLDGAPTSIAQMVHHRRAIRGVAEDSGVTEVPRGRAVASQ